MSCPICPQSPRWQSIAPFCSRRCADIDLARWLRADYAIPVPLTDAEDDVVTDPPNLPESH